METLAALRVSNFQIEDLTVTVGDLSCESVEWITAVGNGNGNSVRMIHHVGLATTAGSNRLVGYSSWAWLNLVGFWKGTSCFQHLVLGKNAHDSSVVLSHETRSTWTAHKRSRWELRNRQRWVQHGGVLLGNGSVIGAAGSFFISRGR